jgi:hypothetical protein
VEVKVTTTGVVDEDADDMASIHVDGGVNVAAVEGKSEGVTV